jgi:hypothetical protein
MNAKILAENVAHLAELVDCQFDTVADARAVRFKAGVRHMHWQRISPLLPMATKMITPEEVAAHTEESGGDLEDYLGAILETPYGVNAEAIYAADKKVVEAERELCRLQSELAEAITALRDYAA